MAWKQTRYAVPGDNSHEPYRQALELEFLMRPRLAVQPPTNPHQTDTTEADSERAFKERLGRSLVPTQPGFAPKVVTLALDKNEIN